MYLFIVALLISGRYFVVESVPIFNGPSEGHLLHRRSLTALPKFETEDYLILEDNQTFRDLVCVRAGDATNHVHVFSATGPEERCFALPCPPATEGEDFVGIDIPEIILKPGERFCLDVTIINDNVIDGREFFLLALEDLRWGEIIDISVVTIRDDDDPSFSPSASQFVVENAGLVQICVQGTMESVPFKVQFLTEFSTASNSPTRTDFTLDFVEGEEMMLAAGETTCFGVMVLDDDLDESLESIKLLVSQGSNTSAVFSIETFILIADNDNSPSFELNVYNVRENHGQFEVCVTFLASSSMTVLCNLSTLSVTAQENSDFVPFQTSFNISGQDKRCNQIQLVDDSVPEPVERLKIMLNASNSEVKPKVVSVWITDDDVLEFEGTARKYTVAENIYKLELGVILHSGSTSVVSQGYVITQPKSALDNADFIGKFQRLVLNETNRTCIDVLIRDDLQPEFEEYFKVYLLTLDSGGQSVYSVFVTVTIMDDEALDCPNLVSPTNGSIPFISNGNTSGSRATYICDRGFRLIGLQSGFRRERVCQVDGTWTMMEPTCQEVLCPPLVNPSNGLVTFESLLVDSVATYSCDLEFLLIGMEQRTCLHPSGIWSGSEPSCQRIVCPPLDSPDNGMVSLDNVVRSIGTVANYSCTRGIFNGSDIRICQEDGSWNGTEPYCNVPVEESGAMRLRLVNNSPLVTGSSVSVEYIVTDAVQQVVGQVAGITLTQHMFGATNGRMRLLNVPPGYHTLQLTASRKPSTSSGSDGSSDKMVISRQIEWNADTRFCGVHLINDGMTVSGDSMSVQFKGRPSSRLPYRCRLDNRPAFDCSEVELITMRGLRPGLHRFKITHSITECALRRKLFLHFQM